MKIALEGTSYSGKSTLLDLLKSHSEYKEYCFAECYVEYLKTTKPNIKIPMGLYDSYAEQVDASRVFIDVDKGRFDKYHGEENLLMDRSYYTILSHAYSIEQMGFHKGIYNEVFNIIEESKKMLCVPDLILFLDVHQKNLEKRANSSKRKEVFFLRSDYNDHFKQFFYQNSGPIEIKVINGNQNSLSVLQKLFEKIVQ